MYEIVKSCCVVAEHGFGQRGSVLELGTQSVQRHAVLAAGSWDNQPVDPWRCDCHLACSTRASPHAVTTHEARGQKSATEAPCGLGCALLDWAKKEAVEMNARFLHPFCVRQFVSVGRLSHATCNTTLASHKRSSPSSTLTHRSFVLRCPWKRAGQH